MTPEARSAEERLVTRRELADLLGVSVRMIDRWRAEGMPAESDNWGIRVVRFKPSAARQWLRGRSLPQGVRAA